ncbi:MAG TPA: MaoC family dehydratase [Candidatus Limnocylindria bacterium]|jgi:acyl dehydratase|nr:MaoC family dehydratase [Candidatus Limnocylindria bacterium]
MAAGRYLEDFKVGDVYRSSVGRTITQTDNIHFSLLTNNANPIHIDQHYAEQTEFGRPLVNSFLTMAVVAGLMVPETSQNGFALGVAEMTLPNPLFDGDTLYADSEVLEVRETRSRRGWGVVKVRQRGIKQDGTVVLVMSRTFMVPMRANAAERDHFPKPRT